MLTAHRVSPQVDPNPNRYCVGNYILPDMSGRSFRAICSDDGKAVLYLSCKKNEQDGFTTSLSVLYPDTKTTFPLWHEDSSSKLLLSCAFSLDGYYIVCGREDGIVMWCNFQPEAYPPLWRISLGRHAAAVTACAFSPCGQCIVSASADHTVRIWNSLDGTCIKILKGHTDKVRACAFSLDGPYIVSASADHTVRIWNSLYGTCIMILKGHTAVVTACAFSLDGRYIVSASADRTVRIWNSLDGTCIKILEGHTDAVLACAFSFHGQFIRTVSSDNTLRVWNFHNPAYCRVIYLGEKNLGGQESGLENCAFSYSGRFLLSVSGASFEKKIKLWMDLENDCVETIRMPPGSGTVKSCALSKDAEFILAAAGQQLILWGKDRCNPLLNNSHTAPVTACAISSDGNKIAFADVDGHNFNHRFRFVERNRDNSITITADGSTALVSACIMSCNDRYTLSLLSGSDYRLTLWDNQSAKKIILAAHTDPAGHTALVTAGGFILNDTKVLSASKDGTLKIWEVSTGICLNTLTIQQDPPFRWVCACAYSEKDSLVYMVFNDNTLASCNVDRLVNPGGHAIGHEGERQLAGITASDQVTAWFFIACRQPPSLPLYLLAILKDGTIKMWNIADNLRVKTLARHSGEVTAWSSAPDGSYLLTAATDESTQESVLRVWDIA